MRVFLDTNVLFAAFATRGLCADVLRLVLAEHQLVTGDVVFAELSRAFTRRLKLPSPTGEAILKFLREQETVPKPRKPADFPVRDPDDRWILASAIAGCADVLVTGDRDLLDLSGPTPMRILSPRDFWELTRKRS